ncbi:uncharacterized protein ACWYII_007690 isoform 1-T1 [Salvelinus alpinus]|uniref:uncharacterized protein n=1 Tax=Salvelinus alpinus TaxID=8036 RepID=UPI0039FD081D
MPKKHDATKRKNKAQNETLKTSTEAITDPNTDPSTASYPGTPVNQDIVKEKKKKRAIILTKDEKNMAALEKTCQAFRSDQTEYERFLDHMTLWLQEHQEQAVELFSLCDTDSTGTIGPENFELGMTDFGIPCLQFQLDLLSQLLRRGNDGEIDYRDMSNQLQRVRVEGKDEREENAVPCCLEITREKLQPSPNRQLGLWSSPPPETNRFILLSIRLIPFDYGGAHPGSFEVVLPRSTRVSSLFRVIEERVGIQTTSLQVFRTRVPSQESFLPPDSSLGQCGFTGGPEDSPRQATLFYDYRLEFTDCPILNCDHYFGSKRPQIGEDYFASRPV